MNQKEKSKKIAQETKGKPKSKTTTPSSWKCERCKKTLDIEHELQNNINRLGVAKYGPMMVEQCRNELMQEIKKKYTCESCLRNEPGQRD